MATLKIVIQKGAGLLNRDGFGQGKSDPFVRVFDVSGKQVLQTPTIDDTVDPVWPADKSTVTIPITSQPPSGVIKCEVWDEDMVGADFLGEARLSVADMCRDPKGLTTTALVPREGEKEKEILSNAGKLGSLTISWTYSPPPLPPQVNVMSPTPGIGGSMPVGGAPLSTVSGASLQQASRSVGPVQQTPAPVQLVGVPPLKFPVVITVKVLRGANLFNRETFGKSDPFVLVLGPDGQELLRTPTMDGNLNPTFPEAKSMFQKRFEQPTGLLTFHVFDEENVGSNKFMGEATLPIGEAVTKRGQGEILLMLKPRASEQDKAVAGASSLGSLFISVDASEAPAQIAQEAPSTTAATGAANVKPLKVIPKMTTPGTLTLRVIRAYGLKNRETFGTSDPYCLALVPSGQELVRTPVVDGSLDPVWPEDKSSGVVRLVEDGGAILFTVFDKNVASDECMGSATLDIKNILTHESGEVLLPLGPRSGETDNFLVKNVSKLGSILVYVSYAAEPVPKAIAVPPVALPGTVTIVVAKANGLFNREATGTSDPYVKLFGPDGKEQLQTPPASSTVNPVWPVDKAKALFRIADKSGSCRVQVFDKNTFSDAFMGEAVITIQDLLAKPQGDIILYLKPRDQEPEKDILKAASLGSVTLNYSYAAGGAGPTVVNAAGQVVNRVKGPLIAAPGRMVLKVLRCANLLPMDTFSKSSDPFVAVVSGGTRIYKSKVIDSNLNPEWKGSDATADFLVSSISSSIFVEVYDYDMGGGEDFIGKIEVVPSKLELTGEATENLMSETLNKDKNRGTISYQWMYEAETLFSKSGQFEKEQPTIKKPGLLNVTISSCSGLLSRSIFGGTSAKVDVQYQGSKIFATEEAKGQNPAWSASQSTFAQFLSQTNDSLLLIVNDDGKFLGQCELSPKSMPLQGQATLSLRPRPNEPEKEILESQSKLGTITVTWSFKEQEEVKDRISKAGTLRITIISCAGLISQDLMGNMEVYAQVRYRNTVVLETKDIDYSIKANKIHSWPPGDATAEVPLVDPNSAVAIWLQDRDMTSSDFLGEALFRPTSYGKAGEVELQLRPRANETDKAVATAKSLGNVRISWSFSETVEKSVAVVEKNVTQQAQQQQQVQQQAQQVVQPEVKAQIPLCKRITLRIFKVRGVQFRQRREDPEVLVGVMVGDQEYRCNPAGPDDQLAFQTAGIFTFTPSPQEQLIVRVFDVEDCGQPLGAASIRWDDPSVGTQQMLNVPIYDDRHQTNGEVVLSIAAEDKVPVGDVRFEIREGKNFTGVLKGTSLTCRATVGGIVNDCRPVAAADHVFFGAAFSAAIYSTTELLTLELIDGSRGTVIGGASLNLGTAETKGEGKVWAQLYSVENKSTPVGVVFVAWRVTLPQRKPLAQYMQPPAGTSIAAVEVLQGRGFHGLEGRHLAVQAFDGYKRCIGTSEAVVVSNVGYFGQIFYFPFDRSSSATMCTLQLNDAGTNTALSFGATVSVSQSEVEHWLQLSSPQGMPTRELLIRSACINGQAVASTLDLTSRSLVVRPTKFDGTVLPGEQLYNLSVAMNGDRRAAPRSAPFAGHGTPRIDENYFFSASSLVGSAKRFSVDVDLFEDGEEVRVSTGSSSIPRTKRSGEITVDLQNGCRATLLFLWLDASPPVVGPHPVVTTIAVLEASLRNSVTKQYERICAELSSGGLPSRTVPSSDPSPRCPRFTSQSFNIVDGGSSLPLQLAAIGFTKEGKEEVIGVCEVSSSGLQDGRMMLPLKHKQLGECATLLVDISRTVSVGSNGKRMKGLAPSKGGDTLLQVGFIVGRPFGTRMKAAEELDVLKPYLAKHFGIPEEDQEFAQNSKPLDGSQTIAGNRLKANQDGIVAINVTSANKRNIFLQARTVTGQLVPLCVQSSTTMWEIKNMIASRDAECGAPEDLRLMCQYNELDDDSTVAFYRLSNGSTLIVSAKNSKSRKGVPRKGPDRIAVCVEDSAGTEHVVQLDLGESIDTLRALMDEEDNRRTDIFLNGELIENESLSLAALGVNRGSRIQFVSRRGDGSSSLKSSKGGKAGSLKKGQYVRLILDVENADGAVQHVEVDANDPISSLRAITQADHTLSAYYNGRLIKNETRSFAEVEVVNGGHFQFKPLAGTSSANTSLVIAQRDMESQVYRQRATEHLQNTVNDLQRQLEASRMSQQNERVLGVKLLAAEKEVDDLHHKYQNALDRIRELEDTIERQQLLLRRAVDSTDRRDPMAASYFGVATPAHAPTPNRFGNSFNRTVYSNTLNTSLGGGRPY